MNLIAKIKGFFRKEEVKKEEKPPSVEKDKNQKYLQKRIEKALSIYDKPVEKKEHGKNTEVFNRVSKLVSIVEEIGSVTKLKNDGKYFKGTCPFCGIDRNRFVIATDKRIFYCFGCQISGDVISFVARYKKLSQIKATQYLVNKYKLSRKLDERG